MHNPTLDEDIKRLLVSMDNNGSEEPKNIKPLEEFDVYIEPDRITIIKRPEPEQIIEAVKPPQPQPPPYFAYTSLIISLLLLSYLVTSAFITVFFPPSVTVTLLTKSKIITATGTIQLQARQIPPITLTQSQSAPATGRGHQNATSATGTVTFYNGEFQSVTVTAGTILTGADGTEIITDETAFIPAANPPLFGQATVSAHAIQVGKQGNIAAYDINEACCYTSVLAKNTNSFTGGQDERTFPIVTPKDITTLASTLKSSLSVSMQRALTAQVKQNETLLTLPCSPTITPDHNLGEEATQVKVTVSLTCSGIAYDTKSLETRATRLLTTQAEKNLQREAKRLSHYAPSFAGR